MHMLYVLHSCETPLAAPPPTSPLHQQLVHCLLHHAWHLRTEPCSHRLLPTGSTPSFLAWT